MAEDFTCPICESLKPGGTSSGNVPPAATHAQFGPWQALGLDASEWAVPGLNKKIKFLLMIDFATKLRVAVQWMEPYPINEMRTESSSQVIIAVAKGWLANYPKPDVIIPDNGMGFVAKEFADFCRDQNIELSMPAEKEPWAHGLVENAMREFKHTTSAIQMDNYAQDPSVTPLKMVTMLTATMSHLALQVTMDGRECLWEIACADNSWLTQAALNHGLPARRINYKQGYDLYKKSARVELEHLRKIKRPKKLWLSLPCAHWCQWTNVNYNTDERKVVLEDFRRRDRRMMRHAKDFILGALDDDPDTDVYWEWTFPCSGWSQPPMVPLQHGLLQRGQSWERCRIDGCNYGMRNSDGSAFIHKLWEVRTNDELFHRNFKCKVCPRNHSHALIQGIETARCAYYPVRMVESIVRHWRTNWLHNDMYKP